MNPLSSYLGGTSNQSSMSPMGGALGLGDLLGQQVKDETDEERKKRLAEMQQRFSPMTSALMNSFYG
jgi:hypothetical protein